MTTLTSFFAGGMMGSAAISFDSTKLGVSPVGVASYGTQRLATDPVGTFNGTFDGINAGTEIRVYLADGTELAGVESCDADHVLSWNRYATGNANNNVDIHIISTVYENIELDYTTPSADAVIPIQQRRQRFSAP